MHDVNYARASGRATEANAQLHLIASTVRKVGTPHFADGVLNALTSFMDADACEIFYEDKGQICLAGRSEFNGAITSRVCLSPLMLKGLLRDAAPGAAVLIVSGEEIAQGTDPHRHQRILIAGRSDGVLSGLHILRSTGRREMRLTEIDELESMSSVLYSMVSRHIELAHKRQQSVAPLDSLDQIEACILATGELTHRESQVCARILYGLSTHGISLDLDVGKESVVTYRKRAYRRLTISCQRELLVWYLDAYDRQVMKPAA